MYKVHSRKSQFRKFQINKENDKQKRKNKENYDQLEKRTNLDPKRRKFYNN